jgi:ABC-type Zn uptake system ZnuABC Zn-binding protein ZnuA
MMNSDRGKYRTILAMIGLCCLGLVACGGSIPSSVENGQTNLSFYSDPEGLSPASLGDGEILRVVATTNIVGDVVSHVGETAIELTVLLPINADPHAYEPTPQDFKAVSTADVMFINGLGLEGFLEEMLKNAGGDVPVISLSERLDALVFGGESQSPSVSPETEDSDHVSGNFDPHVWLDPTNVMVWTNRIADTLSALDPENSALYRENAGDYQEQLNNLDEWIFERISLIPAENRQLVTDHRVFDYLAVRYGFEVVGEVIPTYSSAAEPTAQEIADLQNRVRKLGIKAIFVGVNINPNVVRAVVEDTGVEMIPLYTGSLSDPQGPAGSYIAMMKFDVDKIVEALLD